MTAQLPDRFYYQHADFVLIGSYGDNLPCPHDYGLDVGSWHTASNAGYVNTYAVEHDRLMLHQIRFGGFFDDRRPQINGVKPRQTIKPHFDTWFPWFSKSSFLRYIMLPTLKLYRSDWIYKNLRLPISFTGGMLIGKGAKRPLAHIRGPFDYETVVALRFADGVLAQAIDRSGKVANIRKQDSNDAEAINKPLNTATDLQDADVIRYRDWY